LSFELMNISNLPSVSLTVRDRNSIIRCLDTPGNNNELRIQILPPFDDAYKKINLTFYIVNFNTMPNGVIRIFGSYKSPILTSTQFAAFGEITLYELFDKIASESKLGFATNIEDGDDYRYVYCPYKSYLSILNDETLKSGNDTTVYDWWIDPWNYLNLVNVYERYNSIDELDDDKTKIWIAEQISDITEGVEIEPHLVKAELSNLYGLDNTQLYIKDLRIKNSPGVNSAGTDMVYSTYSMNTGEYNNVYLYNDNPNDDSYYNYEYLGEVYGDYDYIAAGQLIRPFKSKIMGNLIEVDLQQPLLGLKRGMRVNVSYYINDDRLSFLMDNLAENDLINDPETEVPLEQIGEPGTSGTFKLDKSVSGQYLITGETYKFSNNQWTFTLTLARPATQIPKILKEE